MTENLTNEMKAEIIVAKRKELNATRKEFSDHLRLSRAEEKILKLWEENKQEIPDHIFQKIANINTEPRYMLPETYEHKFTQIDLFAGIGGIRLGFQKQGGKTLFSSELDKFAQKTYKANFGQSPHGDITKIAIIEIPDHDVLLAGFPCQPFSLAGLGKGFEDTRGTLFFNIAKIIKHKRPKAFMLENVKQLKGHDKGKTFKVIMNTLKELNYYVPEPQVLNANDFGVPQNRERIFIVGFNKDYLPAVYDDFVFPKGNKGENIKVGDILEPDVSERFTISDKLYAWLLKRKQENISKGISGFCLRTFNEESRRTSTITARYYKDGKEALIEQESKNPRKLTPRECARLQSFPDDFIIPVSNAQAYRQFGNSVCVNVIEEIAKQMVSFMSLHQMI